MKIQGFKKLLGRPAFGIVLGALMIMGGARTARASLVDEYRPLERAVTRVIGAARNVVAQVPYQFDAGVCFGVAIVKRGDFIQSNYPLQKGVDYLFFASGDDSVQNIELQLSDARGKVLIADKAPTGKPSYIKYVPKTTGSHRILMRLRKSKGASAYCAMVVMRRTGGYSLPLSVLSEGAKREAKVPEELRKVDGLVRFHRQRNQWAMYGAVLKQGDSTTLPGLRFESGLHILGASSGDERATDIDLTLSNSAGQRLAQSTAGGAEPGFAYQTNGNQTYNLTVSNRKSKGASMILVFALDVTAAQTATNSGSRAQIRPVNVSINGQPSMGSVEINGAVMVPLRGIFEALGAQVQYIPQTRTIISSSGNDRIVMQVGTTQASSNGRPFQLAVAPVIYAGTTLVPLRFIAEAAGATVRSDANSRTAFIQSPNNQNAGGMNDDMDDYDD